MSVPIEAQSLSSLNHLLSNPPQYPRNPTHKSQKPLVLYIVRVPGSKDVFLTPLKPPTKASISLEAIQSSLYFLHVITPEDEEVRQSLDEEKDARNSENVLPRVTRKPLPNIPQATWSSAEHTTPPRAGFEPSTATYIAQTQNPAYHAQTPRTGLARANSEHNGRYQSIKRKPLQTRHIPLPIDISVHGSPSEEVYESWKGSHEVRPLGPKQTPPYKQDAISNLEDAMVQIMSRKVKPTPSLVTNRPYRWSQPPPRSMPDIRLNNQSPTRSTRTVSPVKANKLHATITLIRRDPVSGAQWNIGTIDQLDSKTFESSLKPIRIELETPGYGKFVRQLEYPRPGSSKSTASSLKQAMASGEFQDLQLDHDNTAIFTRTVEFRRQPISNHSNKRSDFSEFTPNSPIQNKPPRNVFSFTSPWQGLCTFSNGIDGKSIKCRHVLPATNLQEDSVAANIAELRFNLPWSVLGQRDTNKKSAHAETDSLDSTPPISTLLKEPKSSKEAWRKGVQHLRNISKDINKREQRSSIESAYAANAGHATAPPTTLNNNSDPSSSISAEEIDRESTNRLSLKLGREKAGGGFKGNSAKLGKLIIEDEGLKMGDLVVAACMSVWWQHYAGGIGR